MTRRVRVLVAEDEPLARERITGLVRESPGLELVGEAVHGLEALDRITALRPDLVFLDVEMPELTGLEVVAALDESALPGIVFITAYEEYAVQAFEVDAIDYLRKPVTAERFAAAVARAVRRVGPSRGDDAARLARVTAALERARGATAAPRTRFVVRRGSTHTFVPVADVAWIGAADNYLELHAAGRVHLVRGTIRDAEREFAATFLRVHRSAMVNMAHIAAVEAQEGGGYVLRLADGARLRTSRQYAAGVRALVASRR
ncbi:MAG TPA: LytTR family DNA-binding domain-containing protein [Gemmatimonadaceae bacterium]|nr:LytTR family DNA-binding domain-containing protein [Gemmatimonadaceae bacterium]